MSAIQRTTDNEKRDWAVIAFILLLGLLGILLAGEWALRFTPLWELDANAQSKINPDSDFLTHKPNGFIEPVDPAILTNPVLLNSFLTPGSSFSSVPSFPTASVSLTAPITVTSILTQTPTPATVTSVTSTVLASPSSTQTLIFFPPSPTSTPKPKPAATDTSVVIFTSTPTSTFTSTPTSTTTSTTTLTATATISSAFTATVTSTDTPTPTSTGIATATSTFTATVTPTNTPTATLSSFCTTTIIMTDPSGSYAKPSGSTCFQYTDVTFTNGGVFQITSSGVTGTVHGSSCSGVSISDGSTVNYGVAQSGGVMLFRITGSAGTVDINVSDWSAFPACP